ncbi:hypothetical protein TELCIR_21858, partial [Teladorsagia circumcincta]
VCDENITLMETTMTKLADAFDDLEDHTEEEEAQLNKYIDGAQDTIMKLHLHKAELERKMSHYVGGNLTERQNVLDPTVMTPLALSKLPEIPIPIFTGRRWDWHNFWALFQANVHDQDLTELQKFNYLLSSLKGEAKQSISRFHVTPSNYMKAIEHLQRRYGNKDGIIRELNRNLNSCAARGSGTSDQRQLFDKLSVIAAQLREHGEHLDNQLTIQTFLQKFHARVQKAAMEEHLQRKDNPEWSLERWLYTIDAIITKEETLKSMLPKETGAERTHDSRE